MPVQINDVRSLEWKAGLCSAVLALSLSPFMAQAEEPRCVVGEPLTVPVSFVGEHALPVIPATINGHPSHLVFDTANPVSTLNAAAVKQAGLEPRMTPTNYPIDILTTRVDELTVGPIKKKGVFVVVEQDNGTGGNLGSNFLYHYDYELRWADREVTFTRPKNCRSTFLAAWDKDAHTVPFWVHVLKKDLRPMFMVKVNGADVHARIDTAREYTLLDAHTAKRLGITPDMPGAVEDGETITFHEKKHKVWKVPVSDITIGSYHIQNATLRIADLSLNGEMMVLGGDFLRNHRVLVSLAQRRLYISHLGGARFSEPAQQVAANN